jgi:hypothetical protein
MMIVQRISNVFEGAAAGVSAPRQHGENGPADFLSIDFLSTLEGFLALQEAGYDPRVPAEASAYKSEGAYESGDERSNSATRRGAVVPQEVRDAALAEQVRPETVRQGAVGPAIERQEGARQGGAKTAAASPDEKRSGSSHLQVSDLRRNASGNRGSVDASGVEPNAHAHQARRTSDNGKRANPRSSETVSDHRKDAIGASGGTLPSDKTADATRSVARLGHKGLARAGGGEQPERSGTRSPRGADAPGVGKYSSDPFLSALRRTAGNVFDRSKKGDGGNEGEDWGSEGPAKGRASTRAQRGLYRNAPESLSSDGRQGKPEGSSGISLIAVKYGLSEHEGGRSDEGKVRAGNENRGNFGEISLAASRYENTSLRVSSVPDHQIPRNTDEFINEIVRQFNLVARKGGGEAHISLKPDFLGGMRLNLRLDNGEVSSFILVDNPAVKDLIISRLNVLEQGLLQHGLSLGSFQVEVKDGGGGARAEERDGGKRAGASIDTGRVDEAAERVALAPAVLPWMSTLVNITV